MSFICHYTLCHFLRHEEQEYCNDFLFFLSLSDSEQVSVSNDPNGD